MAEEAQRQPEKALSQNPKHYTFFPEECIKYG